MNNLNNKIYPAWESVSCVGINWNEIYAEVFSKIIIEVRWKTSLVVCKITNEKLK